MRTYRYEYRFNLDDSHPEVGVRVQFTIYNLHYYTICGVQELANHPHASRRDWARMLLQKYRYQGKTTLTAPDFEHSYGKQVLTACLNGATVTCLEPNHQAQDILLIIQVHFIFIFYRQ